MHEMGIMASVLKIAEEAARDAGASRVTRIEVVAGELTQVVDEALQFAFEALSPGTCCEGAEVALTKVPCRSRCPECGVEFAHDPASRACPECANPFTELLAGRELYVGALEVED